jgi:squalene-hopene/tetraprenyl-beta-curcumene cyclase
MAEEPLQIANCKMQIVNLHFAICIMQFPPRYARKTPALLTILLCGGVVLAGCGKSGPDPSETANRGEQSAAARIDRIDRARTRAARYLLARQDVRDGAWRSDNYAALKDGPSLTPLAFHALLCVPAFQDLESPCRKAADYLASIVRSNGTIAEGEHGLSYPVYTAACAVQALSEPRSSRHINARDAWLTFLRKRQLTEDLGWKPADKEYGGWGYSIGVPTRANREALTESNISATVFALEALRAAGCSRSDPAFSKALIFVKRCQNFSDDVAKRNPTFDDGGFFFIYGDANRNKAGLAGKEDSNRERFRSYGSATADGLRCLIACGLPGDHPRVTAARRWLEGRFRADANPGDFPEERESRRVGVYFYYAWSASQALRVAAAKEIQSLSGKVNWAEVLADTLMSRQETDGSWRNPVSFYQEDDPVLATSLAARALANCREVITGH